MFDNLDNPSDSDYELIKLIWKYMTSDERKQFVETIKTAFSEWDLLAIKELAKTIHFVDTIE